MTANSNGFIVRARNGKAKIRECITVDFMSEAKQIVEDAKIKAKRDTEKIERLAYEQGFKKGEQAGIELGLQELAPYLDQFKNMAKEIARAREVVVDELEPQIVRLALDISKKIVKQVVERDRETAARIAKEAISQLTGKHTLVIYVSKSDHDLMAELAPEFIAMENVKKCTIEVDPNVEPGGCIIETENGIVDARISVGLDETEKLLEEHA